MTGYLAFLFFASVAGNPTDATLVLHWKDAVNFSNCEALTKGYIDRMQGAPVTVSYFCGDPNRISVIPQAKPQPVNITISPTVEGLSVNGGVGETAQ